MPSETKGGAPEGKSAEGKSREEQAAQKLKREGGDQALHNQVRESEREDGERKEAKSAEPSNQLLEVLARESEEESPCQVLQSPPRSRSCEPPLESPKDDTPEYIKRFRETIQSLLRNVRLIESAGAGFDLGLEAIIDHFKKESIRKSFKELSNPVIELAQSGLFRTFITELNKELFGETSAQTPISEESISAVDKRVTEANFLKLVVALLKELLQPDFFWVVLVQLIKFGKLSSTDFTHNKDVEAFFREKDPILDAQLTDSTPLPTEIQWLRGHVGDYLPKNEVKGRGGKKTADQHAAPYYVAVAYAINVQLLNRLSQTLEACVRAFPEERRSRSVGDDTYLQLEKLSEVAQDHLTVLNLIKRTISKSDVHNEEKILLKIKKLHQTKFQIGKSEKTSEENAKELVLANLLTCVSIWRGAAIGNRFQNSKKMSLKNPRLKRIIADLEARVIQFYLKAKKDPIDVLKVYLTDAIEAINKPPRAVARSEEGIELIKDLENLKGLIDHPTNKYFLESSLGIIDNQDNVNPEHMIKKYIIQRIIILFINLPYDINQFDNDQIRAIHEIKNELKEYHDDPQLLSGQKEKEWAGRHDLDNVINNIISIIWLKRPQGISYLTDGPYNNLLKTIAKCLFTFCGNENSEGLTLESIYTLFFSKPHHELTPKRAQRKTHPTVHVPSDVMRDALRQENLRASAKSAKARSPVTSRASDTDSQSSGVGEEASATGGAVVVELGAPMGAASTALSKEKGRRVILNEGAAEITNSDTSSRKEDGGRLPLAELPQASLSPRTPVAPVKDPDPVTPARLVANSELEEAKNENDSRPLAVEPIKSPGAPLKTPRTPTKSILKSPASGAEDWQILSPRSRVNFTSPSVSTAQSNSPTKPSLSNEDLNAVRSKIIALRLLQLVEEHQYGWSEFSFQIADLAKEIHAKHLHDGEKYAVGILHKLNKLDIDAPWKAHLKELMESIPKLKNESSEEKMEDVIGLNRTKAGSIDYDAWIKTYERNEKEVNFKILLAQCIQVFDYAKDPVQHPNMKTYREELSEVVNHGVKLLHSRSYFSFERFKRYVRSTFFKGNWRNDPEKRTNPIFTDLDELFKQGKPNEGEVVTNAAELIAEGKLKLPGLYQMNGDQSTDFLHKHPVAGFVFVPPQSKSSTTPPYKKDNIILRYNLLRVLDVVIRNTQGKAFIKAINPTLPDDRKLKKYKTQSTTLNRARTLHYKLINKMNSDTPIAEITKEVDEFIRIARKDNQFFWGSEKFLFWDYGSEIAESLAHVSSQFGGKVLVNFQNRVLSEVVNLKVSREDAQTYINNHQSTELRRHGGEVQEDGQGSHASIRNLLSLQPGDMKSQEKDAEPQTEVVLNHNLDKAFQSDLAKMLTISTAYNRSQHGMDNLNNKLPLNAPHQDIVADASLDAMRAYVTSLPTEMAKIQYGKSLKTKVAKMRGIIFADDISIRRHLANFSEKARRKTLSEAPEPNYINELSLPYLDYDKWESEIVILQVIVDRAMTCVDKRRKLLSHTSSNCDNRQNEVMHTLWKAFHDVYERLKDDAFKNSCKRDILARGGIVPYLREIINSKTHFAGVFDPIFARGEFGNLLNDLDDFLNYISMPDTHCARRMLTPARFTC